MTTEVRSNVIVLSFIVMFYITVLLRSVTPVMSTCQLRPCHTVSYSVTPCHTMSQLQTLCIVLGKGSIKKKKCGIFHTLQKLFKWLLEA